MTDHTPRHQRPARLSRFLFGAPYYPEHFSAADRAADPELMARAGFNVVRMGEFAWDRLEPARGRCDFALFDETIARLAAAGVATIFCTPTATPPRWLTAGHDDCLRVHEDGRRMVHGSRQHVCTNNPAFRAESRRITGILAAHYRDNPHVIGWQTDNEYYCHFGHCYCEACIRGFRAWLAARYGSVAALNEAWGTAFWAQTYDDFEQIPLPYPHHPRPGHAHPAHTLDYLRYQSDACVEFNREQVDTLRAARPDWFIFHNGLFSMIDYYRLTEDLDFLGVDVYPGFADHPTWAAFLNERCRAVSGSYIVPEQQSGPGGQVAYVHQTPSPGQMRLWAWQSVAHGADGIMHFRWRTCRFGAENYWCGILDHDNVPRRRYDEIAQEGAEFARLAPRLLGTTLHAPIGVLIEQDQRNAHESCPLGLPGPDDQAKLAYDELWRRHLPVGLIDAHDSFAGLEVLIVPSLPLMDADLAQRLERFVADGGTVLITARTATRDRRNQVIAATPPGLLSPLCGAAVQEFGRLEPGALTCRPDGADDIPAGPGYEILTARQGAAVVARWNPPADGRPHAAGGHPAIVAGGDGRAIYVGTYLTTANVGAVLDLALRPRCIAPLAEAPDLVELTRRTAADRQLLFVLNHDHQPHAIRGLPRGLECLTEKPCDGTLELPAYGVAVIETK